MSDGLLQAVRQRVSTIAEVLAEDGPAEFEAAAHERGYNTVLDWLEALDAENQELRSRIAELEEHRDAISDIGREKTTKEEKVAALVTWAQRQASDEETDRVALKVKDIIGCTGVSRRYAYDLIDELPGRYDWLHDRDDLTQYGVIEIDTSSRDRALVVDLAQLHTTDADVNTFTTRTGGKGVQT